MTISNVGIEQINLGYHDVEDRLLLKLGLLDKTEISAWLTRRLTKNLWRLLQGKTIAQINSQAFEQKFLLATNKEQALADFSRTGKTQKKVEKLDFQKAYDTNRTRLTETPLLATSAVVISRRDSANMMVSGYLELRCQNDQTIKIPLNSEIIHALLNMLQMANRQAAWELSFELETPGMDMEQASALLH